MSPRNPGGPGSMTQTEINSFQRGSPLGSWPLSPRSNRRLGPRLERHA
jgi:hypothetical protein